MTRPAEAETSGKRPALLFGASLAGLCAVLLLDFGVIYTLAVQPDQSARLMKFAYILTVCGMLLLAFQGIMVFRNILNRLGEDRRRAEDLAERLNRMSVYDNQTKAFNRKKFDSVISRELEATQRYGSRLCGIFFDVDNFKEVNEAHGYGVGDKLLLSLSQYVNTRIRNTDYLFRWRGGKFLILAPHVDLDKAAIVAEKLRKAVESTEFSDGVTTSISLAVTEATGADTPDLFIQRLQQGLTGAKAKGRNRTEIVRPT